MATKKKKSPGRPKKYNLDTNQVEQLASFGCTDTEIASFFDISRTTLERNYEQYMTKGRESGKIRLRQMQWASAKKGNVAMLIWLGKQILGQSDKQDITVNELPDGFDTTII